MRHLLLSVKRPFDTRAYLTLVGLLVPAVFAIQPYILTTTAIPSPGIWDLLLSGAIDLLLYSALGAAGFWFASRTGLGMPLIEGWDKPESSRSRAPGVAGLSIVAGILLVLTKALDIAIASLLVQAESAPADAITVPAWQGLLAAFSAGTTEEVVFRLFGLTLLVWLGSLLFPSRTGRPAPGLLWAATILFALLFGLGHLLGPVQAGIPLDALSVIRTMVLNGLGGVLFGWLYWAFGLESAMLAHITADVVKLGLVPLVSQQTGGTRRSIAGVLAGLVMLAVILWSVRAVLRDRKQFPPSVDSDPQQRTSDDEYPAEHAAA